MNRYTPILNKPSSLQGQTAGFYRSYSISLWLATFISTTCTVYKSLTSFSFWVPRSSQDLLDSRGQLEGVTPVRISRRDLRRMSDEEVCLRLSQVTQMDPTGGKLRRTCYIEARNGSHSADYIFKCIFLEENLIISLVLIEISMKFIPEGLNDNKSALVLVMAWCLTSNKSYNNNGPNDISFTSVTTSCEESLAAYYYAS